jgi:hypothetical protein
MKSHCLMCGQEIADGFLCQKCDKPRKPATRPSEKTVSAPSAPAQSRMASTPAPAEEPAAQFDPFPKAPIVPFPIESTSLAITSVCQVLATANVAAVVVGSDRSVKFATDDARRMFGADKSDVLTMRHVEIQVGAKIPQLDEPASATLNVSGRAVKFSLVPLSGSAGGAVLIFNPQDPFPDQTPFATYVRETVLLPLRSLHDSLSEAASLRKVDPLIGDTLSTIDQILSSLELASNVEEPDRKKMGRGSRSVSQILETLAERYRDIVNGRGIALQVDVPALEETFRDEAKLSSTLQILIDNAIHYVPIGGQIVLGARMMEHKEKPLLLFFVMDTGPVIPEEYRKSIFDPGFIWDPNGQVRSGKSLAKVREFAIDRGGQVWVESKSGQACTFFLRIRPDGV